MSKQWSIAESLEIFQLSFIELIYLAQTIHKQHFVPNEIQVSTLLSIKTGNCGEDCKYCAQSVHNNSEITKTTLMSKEEVIAAAKQAKAMGSSRFCMGAGWKTPKLKDLAIICEMIAEIKSLGLETCVSLGLLNQKHVDMLKQAGLDFYNHNIDSSEEYYPHIVTTRTFKDRLDTLKLAQAADIKICCGGILGMGETTEDRIKMLVILANLNPQPASVPLNKLIKIPGTKLTESAEIDPFDFIRIIALARIMLPKSYLRISAGRESMSDETQALCFLAGANSIFYGEQLLTAANVTPGKDDIFLAKLGLNKIKLNHANLLDQPTTINQETI